MRFHLPLPLISVDQMIHQHTVVFHQRSSKVFVSSPCWQIYMSLLNMKKGSSNAGCLTTCHANLWKNPIKSNSFSENIRPTAWNLRRWSMVFEPNMVLSALSITSHFQKGHPLQSNLWNGVFFVNRHLERIRSFQNWLFNVWFQHLESKTMFPVVRSQESQSVPEFPK